MQATAQVLKQLLADSRRVADATGLLEHAVSHLAALAGVSRAAIFIHQTQPPYRVRARAAHGLTAESLDALGGFGTVDAAWAAGLPRGMHFCAVPLAATQEEVLVLCDGLPGGEMVSLVATFLALAVERDQAVTDGLRLRDIFHAGPVVIFRWRNAPGWPVEYVSPNATKELGLGELVDQPYAPHVHPADLERIAAEVTEAMTRQVSYFSQQYRLVDAKGQARDVFDFTHVIRDAAGTVTHFHGYVFDDGDRARAERADRKSVV